MEGKEALIQKTIAYVQETLTGAEGGHDWWHIERVWKNTKLLLAQEPEADHLVCELAALLHDIADSKFHNGDETIGPKKADSFMAEQLTIDEQTRAHVVLIIRNMSFSKHLEPAERFSSPELDIVQDADRLDAIGAIGIARAFNFGGFKSRELYNPKILPVQDIDKETYKKRNGPTINHFYEKLLHLKDLMKTPAAKQIAESRHDYLLGFLTQFFKEWDAES